MSLEPVLAWLNQPWLVGMLVNSLWQGAGIGLLVFITLKALHPKNARVRYLVACAGLFLILFLPVVTYSYLHTPSQPSTDLTRITDTSTLKGQALLESRRLESPPEENASPSHLSWTFSLPTTLSQLASTSGTSVWIVLIWLAGVIVLTFRLLGGQWLIRRFHSREKKPSPITLQLRLTKLSRQLKLIRPVHLYLSKLAVPLTFGWLRPVILLPPSVLTGLTPAQLDMILAHELAHIRRWDYLVNLLQHLIEILLFFHPAVWWLSSQIRRERETCCDDIAVRLCGNDRVMYAKTLATLAAFASPATAMAANGSPLLWRIRRLLGHSPTPSPKWALGMLAAALTFGALLTAAALPTSSHASSALPAFPAAMKWATVIGDVTFTDAYTAIAHIGPGSSVTLEERLAGQDKKLVITGAKGGGAYTYHYSVDGNSQPYEHDAQIWAKTMLRQVVFKPLQYGWAKPLRPAAITHPPSPRAAWGWITGENAVYSLLIEPFPTTGHVSGSLWAKVTLPQVSTQSEDQDFVIPSISRAIHYLAEGAVSPSGPFPDLHLEKILRSQTLISQDTVATLLLITTLSSDTQKFWAFVQVSHWLREHDKLRATPAIQAAYRRAATTIQNANLRQQALHLLYTQPVREGGV